jgi:hypothetical protein
MNTMNTKAPVEMRSHKSARETRSKHSRFKNIFSSIVLIVFVVPS